MNSGFSTWKMSEPMLEDFDDRPDSSDSEYWKFYWISVWYRSLVSNKGILNCLRPTWFSCSILRSSVSVLKPGRWVVVWVCVYPNTSFSLDPDLFRLCTYSNCSPSVGGLKYSSTNLCIIY